MGTFSAVTNAWRMQRASECPVPISVPIRADLSVQVRIFLKIRFRMDIWTFVRIFF